MTIIADAPVTMTTIDSTITIRPENIFEARLILRHSSNRKNSSPKAIHLSQEILEGNPIFEVTGSSHSHPLKVVVVAGTCTLKVTSGIIITETLAGGMVQVLNASAKH